MFRASFVILYPMNNTLEFARNVNQNVTENDISLLQGGFSSQAYKIDIDDNSYVLLQQKDGAVSKSKYGHAFTVLKLLESIGYEYSPKPVWLHPEEKAMIISYFDGVASNEFDFNKHSVDPKELSFRAIDAVLNTASVAQSDYLKLCEKLNVKAHPVITMVDNAKRNGTEWFEIIERSCPDREIVEWIRPRSAQSVKTANSLSPNEPLLRITDPSNPNILIKNSGEFTLIDWDSSSYNTYGPEFFIGYMTHLTDFMEPFRKEITEHVAEQINVSFHELSEKVHEHRRFYEVFDINWAAMMMARVNAGEVEGNIKEFKKIAEKRIADYINEFES
jgi:aminoglycoside phosphotransferase (APT) family kinase protein